MTLSFRPSWAECIRRAVRDPQTSVGNAIRLATLCEGAAVSRSHALHGSAQWARSACDATAGLACLTLSTLIHHLGGTSKGMCFCEAAGPPLRVCSRRGIGARNAASILMQSRAKLRRSLRPFWEATERLARLTRYGR